MEDTPEKRYAPHDIFSFNEDILWKEGEEIPALIFSIPDDKYVENPYYVHYGVSREPKLPSQN